jgi:hypothetical protein
MKNFILLSLSLILSISLQAQNNQEDKELSNRKKSFLQENLDLDDIRMDSFWKTYISNEEKINVEKTNLKIINTQNFESLTIEEANNIIYKSEKIKQTLLGIENKFTEDLRSVLTPIEILQIKYYEKYFLEKISSDTDKSKETNVPKGISNSKHVTPQKTSNSNTQKEFKGPSSTIFKE